MQSHDRTEGAGPDRWGAERPPPDRPCRSGARCDGRARHLWLGPRRPHRDRPHPRQPRVVHGRIGGLPCSSQESPVLSPVRRSAAVATGFTTGAGTCPRTWERVRPTS